MPRPKGSKNKPKEPIETRMSLVAMSNEFPISLFKYLLAPIDQPPKAETKMDQLVEHLIQRALSDDMPSHQDRKLIFERCIPQRKQIEHLGELDAHKFGVEINIQTSEDRHGKIIEAEPADPERGRESHGRLSSGCAQDECIPVLDVRTEPREAGREGLKVIK